MATAETSSITSPLAATPRARRQGPIRRFVRQEPLASAFGALVLLLGLLSAAAPVLMPYTATAFSGEPLERPSANHLLGTDEYGRDLLSRVVYGGRVSLAVGVIATALGIVLAGALGILSAYVGGGVDYLLQRVVDVVQAIPAVVLLLAIIVALGPSVTSMAVALSVRAAIVGSRVIRGAALSMRSAEFVRAAEAIGAPRVRVMALHLAPNLIPLALVLASASLSANIIAEASISFLGFGVQPPTPTWGRMLSDARTYMLSAPMLAVIPSVALAIVVLGVNLMGDALRDRLDPRLRSR